MTIVNIALTIVVLAMFAAVIWIYINKKKNATVEEMEIDDKTFTLLKMKEFVQT